MCLSTESVHACMHSILDYVSVCLFCQVRAHVGFTRELVHLSVHVCVYMCTCACLHA